MNDVSVIRVSRCGITRGTLSGKHVLTLIWMIMTGGSFKIVSNWAVLTGPVDLNRDLDKLQVRWRLVYSSAFSSKTLGGSRPGPPTSALQSAVSGLNCFFLIHRRSGERLEPLLLTSSAGAERSAHHSYSGSTAGAHE